MLAAAAALARRRALAALLSQQPAATRGLALVRRSGRSPAKDAKALAPVPPSWQPVKDKETGCAAHGRSRSGLERLATPRSAGAQGWLMRCAAAG
jgi:hypothetical protein